MVLYGSRSMLQHRAPHVLVHMCLQNLQSWQTTDHMLKYVHCIQAPLCQFFNKGFCWHEELCK